MSGEGGILYAEIGMVILVELYYKGRWFDVERKSWCSITFVQGIF